MMRKDSGFTLIELIITILMSALIIAAAATAFIGLAGQSRTQSMIVESNENMVGLEILRRDVESAGYGLFWNNSPMNYPEAAAAAIPPYAIAFNDFPGGLAPLAIVSKNNAAYAGVNNYFTGSDYLVIKSTIVARNNTSDKWTYVTTNGALNGMGGGVWVSSTPANDNFNVGDRVIALSIRDPSTRTLIVGTSYYTVYNGPVNPPLADANFTPLDPNDAYVVYGIDHPAAVGTPQSPFNRADYFISATVDPVPGRCAPKTGILYKATLDQTTGQFSLQSLLDCVADMQVVYWLDQLGTGNLQAFSNISQYDFGLNLSAQQIRTQLKQVGVYILTHEGAKDLTYTYPTQAPNDIYVGDFASLNGRWYTLDQTVPFNQLHYRWKVYQLLIKPTNLGI